MQVSLSHQACFDNFVKILTFSETNGSPMAALAPLLQDSAADVRSARKPHQTARKRPRHRPGSNAKVSHHCPDCALFEGHTYIHEQSGTYHRQNATNQHRSRRIGSRIVAGPNDPSSRSGYAVREKRNGAAKATPYPGRSDVTAPDQLHNRIGQKNPYLVKRAASCFLSERRAEE